MFSLLRAAFHGKILRIGRNKINKLCMTLNEVIQNILGKTAII